MKAERESHTLITNKMKKIIIILIIASAVCLNVNSQNVDDALRYSQVFYKGSARFMSMGGAFTALGGDLSAISLNPAATGVFRSFEFSLTPQMTYNNVSANWNDRTASDFKYSMNISQAGGVFNLLHEKKETGLVGLNFAYSFNRTNNFNENITISGISTNSSMADAWVSDANGIYYKDLRGAAGIAYDAWIIDTVSNSGASNFATIFSNYGTSTNSTYGQTIKRVIQDEGYSGAHSLSIGGNLSNKLYFGATFNINKLKYTGHYQHLESDDNNVVFDLKNFTYTDHFEASGTGYSLDLGAIYKPVEFLRLGGAIHTPIVYRISEYFYDNVTSAFDNFDKFEFANDPLRYKYTLTTPFRVNGGVAFQIKKFALLSADYEYVDYRMAQFSKASDDYDYSNENQDIKNILKSASNLRFGAEFRIQSVYLRGGYSHYGKAFSTGEVNQDLAYNGISFGIGMRQQNFYFDLAYSMLLSKSKYIMYFDPDYLKQATLNTNKNAFTATIGFKF
jgi:hypothetical protein